MAKARRTPQSVAYGFLSGLYRFTATISVTLAAARTTPPEYVPRWLPLGVPVLTWLKNAAWWAIPVAAALAIVSGAARHWIGPPYIRKIIQGVLDEARNQAFTERDVDPKHFHRVTLFKHVGWRWRSLPWGRGRWPWSGWLCPVLRSAHTSQHSKTIFLAPDDADNAEGIAGLTWSCNRVVMLNEGVPALTSASKDDEIREYAQKTGSPERWVRERLRRDRACPRSFCGVPIEVKGEPWGVIVFDSRSDAGLRHPDPGQLLYRFTQVTIGKLLAEA